MERRSFEAAAEPHSTCITFNLNVRSTLPHAYLHTQTKLLVEISELVASYEIM